MKEMIKKVREEKGGFTLAELLIVVAIVAVLVAIAIPVFTSSLNNAKTATDEANARSLYGDLQSSFITSGSASMNSVLSAQGLTSGTSASTFSLSDGESITMDPLNNVTVTVGTNGVHVTFHPGLTGGADENFGAAV